MLHLEVAEYSRVYFWGISKMILNTLKYIFLSLISFGAGKQDTRSPAQRLATEQAKVIKRHGVMRIDNALDEDMCDRLRQHVLRQQELADIATTENIELSEDYYGVENRRKNRCDLLLSLIPDEDDTEDITLNVLQQVLGAEGTLRPIYEELVTNDGEFYEFATVITNPGSDRQQIHPDLPFRKDAPLYVIFLALQDITEAMGPTTFLLGTHTHKERSKFDNPQMKDEQLANADSRLALLNKGDAVLFDARILHCGNANEVEGGSTRGEFAHFSAFTHTSPSSLVDPLTHKIMKQQCSTSPFAILRKSGVWDTVAR